MIIHVVSFSPADEQAGVGGYEWRYQIDQAKDFFRGLLDREAGTHNLAFVHLEIPDEPVHDEAAKNRINRYLDNNLHLIEPQGNFGLVNPW